MAKQGRARRRARRREKRRTQQFYNRATREANIAAQPGYDELQRQEDRAKIDYQNWVGGVTNAYGGLMPQLQDTYTQYQQQSAPISSGLSESLGNFSDMLAVPLPSSEQQAGGGWYSTIGQGGLELLANMQQRGLDWNVSGQYEAGLSQRSALDNLLQQYKDQVDELNNRRLDLAPSKDEIMSRADQLRQQALERKIAKQGMKSERAFNQLMQDLLSNQLSTDTPRDRRRDRRGDNTSTPNRSPSSYTGTETGVGGNRPTPPVPPVSTAKRIWNGIDNLLDFVRKLLNDPRMTKADLTRLLQNPDWKKYLEDTFSNWNR
jgi:hypothetical protein